MLGLFAQPVAPVVSAPVSSAADKFINEGGMLGAACVVLACVIIVLYWQNLKERDKNAALQEKRHEDLRQTGDRYHGLASENTRAIVDLAKGFERTNQSIDALRRAIDRLEIRGGGDGEPE